MVILMLVLLQTMRKEGIRYVNIHEFIEEGTNKYFSSKVIPLAVKSQSTCQGINFTN